MVWISLYRKPRRQVGFLLIVTPIEGFCNCSMFCCALLFVRSSFAIISIRKIKLVALLCLSSWWLVIVVWLFLTMQRVCLQFVTLVFPDHSHLLFLIHRGPIAFLLQTTKIKLLTCPFAVRTEKKTFSANVTYQRH